MTTPAPATQSHLTESDAARDGGAGDADVRKVGGISDRRLYMAMLAIGGVTFTGILVMLSGLFIAKSVAVAFAGLIILMLGVIGCGAVGMVVVVDLIRDIVNSRGKKRRKPPLRSA